MYTLQVRINKGDSFKSRKLYAVPNKETKPLINWFLQRKLNSLGNPATPAPAAMEASTTTKCSTTTTSRVRLIKITTTSAVT